MRLKQVLLPNITMMKIDNINILPKRCKKKEATKLGAKSDHGTQSYRLFFLTIKENRQLINVV